TASNLPVSRSVTSAVPSGRKPTPHGVVSPVATVPSTVTEEIEAGVVGSVELDGAGWDGDDAVAGDSAAGEVGVPAVLSVLAPLSALLVVLGVGVALEVPGVS